MSSARPADEHGHWVLWTGRFGYHSQFFLPPQLASDLSEEREAECAALRAAKEEQANDDRRRAKTKVPVDADMPVLGPHRQHQFEVARHEVLPNSSRLIEHLENLQAGLYGGRDHTDRQIKALSGALSRGTSRSFVRQPDWRESLNNLGKEMPAFRVAIEVVARSLELSASSNVPIAVPPILLVGPPGVGKSHFCRRLADALKGGSGWLAFDQPGPGADLRGTDVHWSTARQGLLFDLLALGDTANPLVVLDEIDKAARRLGAAEIDVLAQLHSALEPETAKHICDVSLGVELDASMVTYVATANEIKTLGSPILSRFEVIEVGLPSPEERRESAKSVVRAILARLGVAEAIDVRPGSYVVLAEYSPRVIRRAVERAAAEAVSRGRDTLDVVDFEVALGIIPAASMGEKVH